MKKLEQSCTIFHKIYSFDSFIHVSDVELMLYFTIFLRLANISFSSFQLAHHIVCYMKSTKVARSKVVEVQHKVDAVEERAIR